MPADRILQFPAHAPPERAAIERFARNYLGDAGFVTARFPGTESDADDRFFLVLPGTYRQPEPRPEDADRADDPRVIEVYVGDHVDVMTRAADALTMAVAHGLALALAACWNVPYLDDPLRQILHALPRCTRCLLPGTHAHIDARKGLRCDVHVPRRRTGWTQCPYAFWTRFYGFAHP